jgi:hypothetical protein
MPAQVLSLESVLVVSCACVVDAPARSVAPARPMRRGIEAETVRTRHANAKPDVFALCSKTDLPIDQR